MLMFSSFVKKHKHQHQTEGTKMKQA